MANFPISIKDLGLKTDGDRTGIEATVGVHFVGQGDGGFSGDAGLIVWAKQSNNGANWQYDAIDLTSVNIDIEGGAFTIKGSIKSYREHSRYGTGFKGMVKAVFTPGFGVEAVAQFGTKDDVRYWMADALLLINGGATVFPGFAIYAFGGGASYHMNRELAQSIALPKPQFLILLMIRILPENR